MMSPSRGTIRSWPVRPGKYARANICKKRCRVARVVASTGAAFWICGASLPIDRLTSWLDTVQVIATRVRVIAIRDPTLRMRALLADYKLLKSALILVPSTSVWQEFSLAVDGHIRLWRNDRKGLFCRRAFSPLTCTERPTD